MIIKDVLLNDAGESHSPIPIDIAIEDNLISIRPKGYGVHEMQPGEGWIVAIERYEGRLRVIVFDGISSDTSQLIDVEGTRESNRR